MLLLSGRLHVQFSLSNIVSHNSLVCDLSVNPLVFLVRFLSSHPPVSTCVLQHSTTASQKWYTVANEHLVFWGRYPLKRVFPMITLCKWPKATVCKHRCLPCQRFYSPVKEDAYLWTYRHMMLNITVYKSAKSAVCQEHNRCSNSGVISEIYFAVRSTYF